MSFSVQFKVKSSKDVNHNYDSYKEFSAENSQPDMLRNLVRNQLDRRLMLSSTEILDEDKKTVTIIREYASEEAYNTCRSELQSLKSLLNISADFIVIE